MSKRKIGGSVLKSVISILTAVAVLVLTLPNYMMDIEAVTNIIYFDQLDFTGQNYDLTMLISGNDTAATGLTLVNSNYDALSSSGTMEAGKIIMLPADYDTILGLFGINASTAITGLDANTQVLRTEEIPYREGPESIPFTFYRLTNNVSYSIDGFSVRVTGPSTQASSNTTNNSSSNKKTSAPAVAGTPMDPATVAAMWAQYNAWVADRDARLAQQRETDKINQAKILQANIDNRYFFFLNQAKSWGKNYIVLPNHAVIPSQINGTYLANSVPGFAAQPINLLFLFPLHIVTWNIDANKAPEAMAVINNVANDNNMDVVGAMQVNVGVEQNGEISYDGDKTQNVANLKFAVPQATEGGSNVAVVQVFPGGGYHMYRNQDLPFENGVVTVGAPIGQAGYGVLIDK